MPGPAPGTGPDDEQGTSPAAGATFPAGAVFPPAGAPFPPAGGFAPAGDFAPPEDCAPPGGWARAAGSAWPGGLDYQVLLDGLAEAGFLDGRPEDQDAVLAGQMTAAEEGRMLPADPAYVAGVVAVAVEHMDPGPAQAGWLEVAAASPGSLDEDALAGMAAGAQKLASRGQAVGLAAAAQITARAAAADPRIGVGPDGRPARLCRDAVEQIRLGLMLTDHSAGAWADLAITLTWRLPATGQALAAGVIDYWRARIIAEATSVLSEDKAREAEEKVLPGAGKLTTAELRDRLHWAVIAVDPDGAERRRQAAERRADVRLYAEDDQTATLLASKLPQVEGAAGYARVNAMARARMAAGSPGTLGFNRAQILLGLLLGTLPPIPPAEGAPPGPRPGNDGPHNGSGPGNGGPGGSDPGHRGPGHGGPRRGGSDDGSPGDGGLGQDVPGGDPGDCGPADDVPAPRDEDAPPDDGLDDLDAQDQDLSWDPAEEDDDPAGTGPAPVWPALGVIPPALRAASKPATEPLADGRPAAGLLDVTVPWVTYTGTGARPGILGRIGPVTPVQARQLAQAAEADPGAHWRIIVTNDTGQAIAVTRIRRRTTRHPDTNSRTRADLAPPCRSSPPGTGPPGTGPPGSSGLVGRITLTISQDTLAALGMPVGRRRTAGRAGGTDPPPPLSPSLSPSPPSASPLLLSPVAAAALRAARRAVEQAAARAEADQAAGGCAHGDASASYRPPPRLREYVIARDVTCRNPACRQPAWRADLDHTTAFDQAGRTCRCNLGGACRRHHQLKQHPRWKLEQTRPGEFTWTTPAGRRHTTTPDVHPV